MGWGGKHIFDHIGQALQIALLENGWNIWCYLQELEVLIERTQMPL